MRSVQVSLPLELAQRSQRYRRFRGNQLGIPIIDLQVALETLLDQGLALVEEDHRLAPPEGPVPGPPSNMLSCAARKLPHLKTIGLDGPHRGVRCEA